MSEPSTERKPVEFVEQSSRQRIPKPTTIDERIGILGSMLQNAEAEKQELERRLERVNNFLEKTNDALVALKLHRVGVSMKEAWEATQRGEDLVDLLKRKEEEMTKK